MPNRAVGAYTDTRRLVGDPHHLLGFADQDSADTRSRNSIRKVWRLNIL
jgi:hypothetical protein